MTETKAIKLLSWNVNGIRAVLQKNFWEFFEAEQPDILCLQETKASPEQVAIDLPGYHAYWNAAQKKGYSGTAVFTRYPPLDVQYGIGIAKHDQEGRVITCEFAAFFLVNVYTPNAQDDLRRLPYRSEEWDKDFLSYIRSLEQKKPVVFCGDLNVAHKEIDLANPKTNTKSAGFTPQERAGFDRIVEAGYIDSFRYFHPEPHQYTWWSYRTAARQRNVGWRIDYFCVSPKLKEQMKAAKILAHVLGSDHCPVSLELAGVSL